MKITIGIPLYNHQEFIGDAIESALAQTVKPHEIIVVDDGSTDNSAEIVSKYPVKLIRQTNRGLSSARNTIIMNMTGDYLLPFDSDDMLKENCIEVLTKAIKKTKADVVAPSFKEFGLSNREVILMPNPTLQHFRMGNRIGYCSAIKKEALLEIGGYSTKMVWGFEDYHLWHNLLARGKTIVTIPDVLWLYRTREGSMISESNKHAEELMKIINKDFPHE